jgi:hypothetical protein
MTSEPDPAGEELDEQGPAFRPDGESGKYVELETSIRIGSMARVAPMATDHRKEPFNGLLPELPGATR